VKVLTVFLQTIVLLSVSMGTNVQSPIAAMRSTAIGVGDVAPNFRKALRYQRGPSGCEQDFCREAWIR
jgi:hypothetical protein